MRTFIAIELPQEIKDKLGRLQDKLKKCRADVKWVEPKNIHLTLKFLGEIKEERLNKINRIIEDIARNKFKFKVTLAGLGVFPSINHPKIIWVGIKDINNEIGLIAEELEEKLKSLDIPKEERQFLAHITLGRIKSPLNINKLIGALDTLRDEFFKENFGFIADKITILKSTLNPGGPLYEHLKEITFSAT